MDSDNDFSNDEKHEQVPNTEQDGSYDDDDEEEDTNSHLDELNQPRVPLHIDPEFIDPKEAKYKFGMLYLSYIPDGLNVKILREMMGQFGEVGRIYLEPEEEKGAKKRRSYIEGWVEFKKKRVAKNVAKTLNGTPLQYGRKHCKFNGQMWSIKYLHRFKWAHLADQLAHNKAVREQKRRFEMSQAKKQSDFWQKNIERSKMMKKFKHKPNEDQIKGQDFKSKQKKPIDDGEEVTVPVDEELLTNIFKKVS